MTTVLLDLARSVAVIAIGVTMAYCIIWLFDKWNKR
jgi:hypothetical protein